MKPKSPATVYARKCITLPKEILEFGCAKAREAADQRGRRPNFSEWVSDLIAEARRNDNRKEA